MSMPRAKSKPLTPADVAGIPTEESEVEILTNYDPESTGEASAADMVHKFLTENHIKTKLVAVNELNVWVGDGTILNDKPLLKVTYVKE